MFNKYIQLISNMFFTFWHFPKEMKIWHCNIKRLRGITNGSSLFDYLSNAIAPLCFFWPKASIIFFTFLHHPRSYISNTHQEHDNWKLNTNSKSVWEENVYSLIVKYTIFDMFNDMSNLGIKSTAISTIG